eukprot:TRINITY_DN18114_c0_g1_i4.p1 TRINITY_DN18114_c0_g1~~TRINITY_DN18114_c0_g1_i4.p1  ORF type:complete len:113 (+),score=39.25 TRINITY_DN18114_c0_g1_i4:185-523(+)
MCIRDRNMECSPRIGKSHFGDYNGKVVRFVGKVKSNNGGVAVLEAPDGGEVTVQNSTPYSTQFVEVLGSVQGLSLIHISEPTRLLSISYAVFCLKKKKKKNKQMSMNLRTII